MHALLFVVAANFVVVVLYTLFLILHVRYELLLILEKISGVELRFNTTLQQPTTQSEQCEKISICIYI